MPVFGSTRDWIELLPKAELPPIMELLLKEGGAGVRVVMV
jgi:hypothetical protein